MIAAGVLPCLPSWGCVAYFLTVLSEGTKTIVQVYVKL